MADDQEKKLIIDEDWKTQAQQERISHLGKVLCDSAVQSRGGE